MIVLKEMHSNDYLFILSPSLRKEKERKMYAFISLKGNLLIDERMFPFLLFLKVTRNEKKS